MSLHLNPLLVVPMAWQLRRMGGPGLVLLGIADNSVVPIAAGLGYLYGVHILRFFSRYYKPAISTLVALAVLGGVVSLIQILPDEEKGVVETGCKVVSGQPTPGCLRLYNRYPFSNFE